MSMFTQVCHVLFCKRGFLLPYTGIILEPLPPVEPTVAEVHRTLPDTGVQTHLNLGHSSEFNASNVDQRDPLRLSRISTNQVFAYFGTCPTVNWNFMIECIFLIPINHPV